MVPVVTVEAEDTDDAVRAIDSDIVGDCVANTCVGDVVIEVDVVFSAEPDLQRDGDDVPVPDT